MRVCHAISSIDWRSGGPTMAMRGLAMAQVRAGLDVSVVSTFAIKRGNDIVEELQSAGVKVTLIGPCSRWLSRHPDIRPTLQRLIGQADVVHIHALWEEVQHQAATIAFQQRVPYVFRPCGMLDPWSLSQGKWKKKLYMAWRLRRNLDRAALIHCTTGWERDLVRQLGLTAPLVVVPNGVPLDEYKDLPPRGEFRARYSQIGDRRVILFLGRIHSGKGLELLVPAMALLKNRRAMLVVVGPDGNLRGEIDRLVQAHSLQDRVLFVGMLTGRDKVAALVDADLVSLPSYHENFGITVVEALAAGTPVVISDHVGLHSEIASAGVGAVVPLDVEALSAELDKWQSDDVLRGDAARKARPFVQQNFDWNLIARRWRELYAEVASVAVAPATAAPDHV